MTIVDILLHKWNYLDARRRQLLYGGLIVLLIILVTSSVLFQSDESNDNNNRNNKTQGLVASPDFSAIGSFRGEFHLDGKSYPLVNLVKLKSTYNKDHNDTHDDDDDGDVNSSIGNIRFQFELDQDNKIDIVAYFHSTTGTTTTIAATENNDNKNDTNTDNIQILEANQVIVNWQTEETGFGRCRLEGADNYFAAPKGKHYLCSMTKIYSCKAINDGDTTVSSSIDTELVVDHIELELKARPQQSASSGIKFGTESFSCTSTWWFGPTKAAPTQLELCITMAETSISDLTIPSEVIMLERKIWIVNEDKRWRVSLTKLLQDKKKNSRIPNPAKSAKHQKSFDKVIMRFIKETNNRLKLDAACGEELAKVLLPQNEYYDRLVASKHSDLDYIVGLADMCVRYMAEQITLIT